MEYQPLNATNEEIRLVTIIPTPPTAEKSIEQSDHHGSTLTDLESRDSTPNTPFAQLNWSGSHESPSCRYAAQRRYSWGDYVALSYAWGDNTDTRDIILNGHKVAVGANLESALRVLRHKQPIKSGYKVWVDALCINQRDIVERGQEVKRMGKIYRQACNVVIWLGNEGKGSDTAMDLIRTLSNACSAGQDKKLGDSLRQRPDLLGQCCWRALSELLDRPYWDRLWVLQEIALGGGRTAILCGQEAVTWGEFYDAIYSFGTHNVDVFFSLIDRERKAAGLPASGLKRNKLIHLNTEQSVQRGHAKPQFMCMLDLGRKSLVTDPRDKIYGLLGMMEASVSDQIVPDYTATLQTVFTDFAKAFISAMHLVNTSGRSTYYATKSSGAYCRFDFNDQSLSCQGFRIDDIDGLGESYLENLKTRRSEDAVVQPSGNKNAYGSNDAFKDALWSTLVGNRDPRGFPAPLNYQCLLECLPKEEDEPSRYTSRGRTAFNRLITESADFMMAGKTLSSYFVSAAAANDENSREPMERVFRFARTRRLMVTLDGLIGFVPNGARQGDTVFLLLGCNVPIVLRAVESQHYKVVGSCYVHGIMEGEAMGRLEAGLGHIEKVVLC